MGITRENSPTMKKFVSYVSMITDRVIAVKKFDSQKKNHLVKGNSKGVLLKRVIMKKIKKFVVGVLMIQDTTLAVNTFLRIH